MPAPQVTVAGELQLWAGPAEIPADSYSDIAKLGQAASIGEFVADVVLTLLFRVSRYALVLMRSGPVPVSGPAWRGAR